MHEQSNTEIPRTSWNGNTTQRETNSKPHRNNPNIATHVIKNNSNAEHKRYKLKTGMQQTQKSAKTMGTSQPTTKPPTKKWK